MAGTALGVVAVDEVTKAIALSRGGTQVNLGVSFGLLADHPALATLASTAALCAVAIAAWKWARTSTQFLALGLILGGGVGNGLNWLALGRSAGVIDWIRIPGYPAAFNIADVAIRLGVVIIAGQLAWSMLHRSAAMASEGVADPTGNKG